MAEEERSPYGRGWFRVPNFVVDDYGSAIGAHGVAVYVALACFAGEEGECWPALVTLARSVGASRPTVIKALRALESAGLIRITRPGEGAGPHRGNLYTLLPRPEAVHPSR